MTLVSAPADEVAPEPEGWMSFFGTQVKQLVTDDDGDMGAPGCVRVVEEGQIEILCVFAAVVSQARIAPQFAGAMRLQVSAEQVQDAVRVTLTVGSMLQRRKIRRLRMRFSAVRSCRHPTRPTLSWPQSLLKIIDGQPHTTIAAQHPRTSPGEAIAN